MKRIRVLVAVVLAGVIATVGGVHADAALDTPVGIEYSEVKEWTAESSRFGLEDKLSNFGMWIQCKGVVYWETNTLLTQGTQRLIVKGGCTSGLAVVDNHTGVWRVDPEGPCGAGQSNSFNAGDSGAVFQFDEIYSHSLPSDGCGPVTNLCYDSVSGDDFCIPVGSTPKPYQDPDGSSGDPDSDGCESMAGSTGAPGVRFVGEPEMRTQTTGVGTGAVTVELFVQVVEFRVPFGATGVWKGGLWLRSVPPNGSIESWAVHPGETAAGTPSSKTGPLGTRALGLAPAVSGTGLAADGEWHRYVFRVSASATATGGANPTDPTVIDRDGAQVWTTGATGGTISIYNGQTATSPTQPGSLSSNIGGLTWADICTWYWGDAITTGEHSIPVGDVPFEEDPELVMEEEPNVYVGPPEDCPPEALVCVNPGGDDPDNPDDGTPDPDPEYPEDDATCSGFSLTDPSSWGGATVCVLIKLLNAVIRMAGELTSLLAALIDAVMSLLELLAELFIPDPSLWDISGLIDQVQSRAPFSLFAGLGDGVTSIATSYQGSGCDTLGGFVLSGETVNINCNAFLDVPGATGLRALVEAGLIGVTTIYIFNLLSSLVSRSQS